ncbi:hypothetical protein GW16_15420 [Xanthomonas arboricola pv. celebensis]|nr:hypothetical protein GW16_15420 [Xanthomonas arboricola pv. celebensis]
MLCIKVSIHTINHWKVATDLISITFLFLASQLYVGGVDQSIPFCDELGRQYQASVRQAFSLIMHKLLPMRPALMLYCCQCF